MAQSASSANVNIPESHEVPVIKSSNEDSCFVCGLHDRADNILTKFTRSSNHSVMELIRQIFPQTVSLQVVLSDFICVTCSVLIEEMDHHFFEAKIIRDMLQRSIVRRHKLSVTNEKSDFPDDDPAVGSFDYSDVSDFVCKSCNFYAQHSDQVTTHYKLHKIVNKRSSTDPIRERQKRFKVEKTPLSKEHRCFLCPYEIFLCADDLNKHIRKEHPKTCRRRVNSYKPPSPPELEEKDVQGEGVYCCLLCDHKTNTELDLYVHAEMWHKRIELRKHQYWSEKDGIRCRTCGRLVGDIDDDCKHNNAIVEGKLIFECTICIQRFLTRELLDRHMNDVHLSCTTCDAIFQAHTDVLRHKSIHKGAR